LGHFLSVGPDPARERRGAPELDVEGADTMRTISFRSVARKAPHSIVVGFGDDDLEATL
jgi:hypothetical protein